MKKFTAILILVGLIGLGAMVFAFMSSASPYVTVKQAKGSTANNLHLAGEIVSGTLRSDPINSRAHFDVKDEEGQVITVSYTGIVPANLTSANRAVAVGHVQNGEFVSEKLYLKCPSKYEAK
jgi:cytochrome c-type biogenesis protein CcmE